ALLPALIMLSHITCEQIFENKQAIHKILDKLHKNNKKYKDGKHMRPLIFGLQAVFNQKKINKLEDKFLLVNKVLDYDFVKQKECWWLIQAILMLSIINNPRFEEFYQKMKVDIQKAFKDICVYIFQINHENISNYEKYFENKYNKSALLIYYIKMQLLPEDQKMQMLNVLNNYINSVLTNDSKEFYDLRYNENYNNQLKTIFHHYPDLKTKWQEGYFENYEKFIKTNGIINNNDNKKFDLKTFLITKIINYQHLPLDYCEDFNRYVELINQQEQCEKEKQEIEKKLEQQTNVLSKEQFIDPNFSSSYCNLQIALIHAIKNNPTDLKEQVACLW
ncbi:MAG: hypothetical protein ACR2HS_03380, partial [Gammaproteobacteria bacterium]